MRPDLKGIRHVALDLDGTIYRGARLLQCALPFLARLRALGIGKTLLTNNTSLSKRGYVAKLRRLGVTVTEAEIYTAADSTIAYLRKEHPEALRIGVLGTPSLCAQMEGAGFRVGWQSPQAVVIGFDTALDYRRLCRAAFWIREGLPFLATHPDLVCPSDEDAVLVDGGSICACLTAATGRRPVVPGKPDPAVLLTLCENLGLPPEALAMVGDRLYTDIAMAQAAGVLSVLVLTGEATAGEARALERPPDLVVADAGEFGEMLVAARRGEVRG